MTSMESKAWNDFQGIEYTAFFRGPVIYNSSDATERALDIVEVFLNSRGLSNRRCSPAGMGAATGGPPFVELLMWLQEHWELAAAAVSALGAGLAKAWGAWKRIKRGFEQRVLDPYKPSIVVELRVRTAMEGDAGRQEAADSFRSTLVSVPDLSTLLRRDLPDYGTTIRVVTAGAPPRYPYVYFKVKEVRGSDIARMVQFLERKDQSNELSAVLLYRQLGFLTRLVASKDHGEFMQLTMRS